MTEGATRTARRAPARRGEGERLREEIVEAACRLLDDSGDPGTLSLRAVARAVGVATTSIYLHFEDLGALVCAVKERWLDLLVEQVHTAMDGRSGDPVARIRAIAAAYVDAGIRAPNRYRILFTTPFPHATAGAALPLGTAIYRMAVEQVRAAVPATVDADMVTVQLWCALHGLVTLRQSRPRFPWPDLDRQVDDLVDRLIALAAPRG